MRVIPILTALHFACHSLNTTKLAFAILLRYSCLFFHLISFICPDSTEKFPKPKSSPAMKMNELPSKYAKSPNAAVRVNLCFNIHIHLTRARKEKQKRKKKKQWENFTSTNCGNKFVFNLPSVFLGLFGKLGKCSQQRFPKAISCFSSVSHVVCSRNSKREWKHLELCHLPLCTNVKRKTA